MNQTEIDWDVYLSVSYVCLIRGKGCESDWDLVSETCISVLVMCVYLEAKAMNQAENEWVRRVSQC